MPISIVRHNRLKETLWNTSQEVCGTDEQKIEYGRGILVGVVGTFVAAGKDFADAIAQARLHCPELMAEGTIPEHWQKEFFGE